MIQTLIGLNEYCKQPTRIRAEGRNKHVVGNKARTSEARLPAPRRWILIIEYWRSVMLSLWQDDVGHRKILTDATGG